MADGLEIILNPITGQVNEVPYDLPVPTLAEAKAARLADLANIRWQHEVAGIVIPYNGQPVQIRTDREVRTELYQAMGEAEKDDEFVWSFKMANAIWVRNVPAAAVLMVGSAVKAHIKACFDNELTLNDAILAATSVEAVQAIDLTVGWPG
ncbi:DUF4376 domain-containing protein [Novosphingobium sp. JCM 18896]|uniref:DUF4376 domain-containing protein n=1 Tax=Novosphingobium sp. JCM 18896 TaxID=2989731 RepID=UPI002222E6B3|nr:DUF4376 domain-containing protein [Novosphingobium sp. JCM 18896]MCW1431409.1 DUF4376 domain-containing protein [Novosphingobium sp. JCM 18896]